VDYFVVMRREAICRAWWAVLIAALALVCITGCGGKKRREAELRAAFMAGQIQALQQAQAQAQQPFPSVRVIGPVKRDTVPWVAGLTLAQAILTAEYVEKGEPKVIRIIRRGEKIDIDPQKLVNRQIPDPPLEPGDVVELSP